MAADARQPLLLAHTIGKALIAVLFWWDSIFLFLMDFQGTVAFIDQKGLPLPAFVAAITSIFLLVAPAMLFFRKTEALGFLGLACFCVLTAIIFHNYWMLDPPDRVMEQIQFMKDLALAGAMLALAAAAAEKSSRKGQLSG